jgi:hypothetical protein
VKDGKIKMPSKSKAQRNLMAAAAHNPAFAKKVGVPMAVAKEFNQADKGKKFKGGGMAKKLFKGKETYAEELKEAKAIKSGKITPTQYAKGEESEKKMKKGGSCKKMAVGGATAPANMPSQSNFGGAQRGLDRAAAMSGRTMPTTGRPTVVRTMKKGGSCKGYAKGGGIEVRGKTKGRII